MLPTDRERLGPEDFSTLSAGHAVTFRLPAAGVNLEEIERQLLVQALDRARGNQTHAGQRLGVNRDRVRCRIETFGLRGHITSAASRRQATPCTPDA